MVLEATASFGPSGVDVVPQKDTQIQTSVQGQPQQPPQAQPQAQPQAPFQQTPQPGAPENWFSTTAAPPGTPQTLPQQMPQVPGQVPVQPQFQNADGSLNAQAVLQAYQGLQQQIASQALITPPAPTNGAVAPPVQPGAPPVTQAPQQPYQPALAPDEMQALGAEMQATGTLSEWSLSRLEQRGIPRAMALEHVAGQQARAQLFRSEVHQYAGGPQQYEQLRMWMQQNLHPQEQQWYVQQLQGMNLATAKMAVESMAARMTASGVPARIEGTNHPALGQTVQPITEHEMKTAMRDIRYRTDPAFRKEIQERVKVSQIDRIQVNVR